MKKLLSLLLLMALTLGLLVMGAVGASAAETTHTDHCVCGGHAQGGGDHSCETVTWTAWESTTSLPETTGNYYLTANVTLSATETIAADNTVNLCLNGYSVSSKYRVYKVYGTWSVTDCGQEADWGTITSTNGGTYGGIGYVYNAASIVNVFGGNMNANGTNIWGSNLILQNGTLNVYNGNLYGGNCARRDAGGTQGIRDGRGATVYLMAGTFNLYGGDLSGGKVQNGGGNVCVAGKNAVFNMTGGTISGGKVDASLGSLTDGESPRGGNLYANLGTVNLMGGSITGGVCEGLGKDVYVTANASLTVGGNVTIGDLYLPSGATFTTVEDFTGSIGLTAETKGQVLTTVAAQAQANCFTSVDKAYAVKAANTGSGYNILLDDHPNHCVCGGHAAGMTDHTCAESVWIPWGYTEAEQTSLPTESGSYYLVADVTLTEKTEIAADLSVNICLHGNSFLLNTTGRFNVRGDLSLTDCGSEEKWGGIVSTSEQDYGGIFYTYTNSTLNVYAGNLDASGATMYQGGIGVISQSGSVMNIYGGNLIAASLVQKSDTVTDTRGGAFYVIDNAVVNMYGGTVTGGSSLKNGGSIYALSSARINLYGGTVTGGQAAASGGNIYTAGPLTVDGATVTQGTAGTSGGNIYIANGAEFTLSGGTVSYGKTLTNTSSTYAGGNIYIYGVNNDTDCGKMLMTGGTVMNGTAYCGGNIYVGGTLEMQNGTVKDGVGEGDNSCGGNIYLGMIRNTATKELISSFIMSGGIISDGTAEYGGSMQMHGSFTMTGGTISGGKAAGTGGTIRIFRPGNFVLDGGTVIGGTATGNGGAIQIVGSSPSTTATYAMEATLTVKSGTIQGGSAKNGGAISAEYFSVLNIEGGRITDGTVTGNGSCIYISNSNADRPSSVTISGDPVIAALYVNNSNENYTMDVSQLTGTTTITLQVAQLGAFADSSMDVSDCFTMAEPIYEVRYDRAQKKLLVGYAELEHVYVSATGSDEAVGTEDAPVLTMDRAMNTVKNGGTIHLVGTVELTVWEAHEKSFTITGDELVMPETRVYLNDHVTFDDLTLTMPMCTTSTSGNYGSYFFYCDGFTTVIQEGVTIRYLFDGQYLTDPYHTVNQTLDDGTTKELNATSYLYGGCNSSFGTVSGTDLTVMSGVWGNIFGGNNAVDLTGDIHLTVGGKVNEGVDYVSHTHSGWHLILGGSRVANIDGTIYMDVIGGNNHTSTHGGSQGNSTTTYSIGAIELHASGGNGMAIYGGGRGGELNIGTINFYYEGATFEQVFGGSLSQCVTGDVNLTVTGGSITRRLYGGCYTNREESLLGSWDPINYVTGNVNLIIGSGADISCNLMKPDGSELYNDRGIYGHSRQPDASASDAENARIIFLDYAAYTKHEGNLKAQDTVMQVLMSGVTAADYICYLGWSANDETDVITSGATEVEDNAGNALDLPAQTATLKIEDGQFGYQDTAVTPAYVEYSDNWDLGELTLTYANNNAVGTATATASINGYSVSKDFEIQECKYLAIVNGQTSKYLKLQDAVDNAAGGYVKLLAGCSDAITVNTDLYLDLNGFDLTGTVTVAEGATLYGMDSTTDGYDCSDGYGKITDLVGTYAAHHKTDVTGRILRYLAVNEDGTMSFHRIYLGITKVYLKPGTVGFGYKAVFGGDEKVQALLGESEAFGYGLWVEGSENKVTRYKGAPDFKTGQLLTLGLNNIDVENYSATQICAEVYLKLEDGTVITSAAYSYSLQDMVKALDSSMASDDSSYSESQIAAVKKLYQTYATVMEGWNLNYINKE